MNRALVWRWIQYATILLVVVAVGWTIWQGWRDLQQQDVAWNKLRWAWLWPAVGLSFLGTVPGWLFWHTLLHRFGLPISMRHSFRAFYLSQLGKYIPGKVMVVAIRASIAATVPKATTGANSNSFQPWLIVSAAAVVETLMFIAVGSSVGTVCGASLLTEQQWVLVLGAAFGGGILFVMLPPVLRVWIVRLPLLKSRTEREWLAARWTWDLFAGGSLAFVGGWLLLGGGLLSLTMLLPEQDSSLTELPRTTAGVTLSTVIGFLSFVPGGLGVREIVLFPILRPKFPAVLLLIVLQRFVVLAAECLAAALAYAQPIHQPPSE
ncbi:MAG: flippase-like domain-containing protein [Planctomycetaceae bacterium]|nr:flippase-like domain-containing protein [Planctomycetaceae bacterium]